MIYAEITRRVHLEHHDRSTSGKYDASRDEDYPLDAPPTPIDDDDSEEEDAQ